MRPHPCSHIRLTAHFLLTVFLFLPTIWSIPVDHSGGLAGELNKRNSWPLTEGANRALFASHLSKQVNHAIFRSNPEVNRIESTPVKTKGKNSARPPSQLSKNQQKFMNEEHRDTVAMSLSRNRKVVDIAMNVKERQYSSKGLYPAPKVGYQPNHQPVIKQVLKNAGLPKDTVVNIHGPRKVPKTPQENANAHAEMTLISNHNQKPNRRRSYQTYEPPPSSVSIGSSKAPCAGCAPVLKEVGVNVRAAGGTSLDKSKITHWDHPTKIKAKTYDTFPLYTNPSNSPVSGSRRSSISTVGSANGNLGGIGQSAQSRRASFSAPLTNSRPAYLPAAAPTSNRRASFSGPVTAISGEKGARASIGFSGLGSSSYSPSKSMSRSPASRKA